MHVEEVAGQAEGVGDVAGHDRRIFGDEELRQDQQAVAIGLCRLAGDGTAGLGRDVGQIFGGAGHGAGAEVEAEAELVEQGQLEAGEIDGEVARGFVVQRVDGQRQQPVMRIALGQQAEMVADELAGIEPVRSAMRSAARASISSTAKVPRCSARRARQATCTVLPGCSVAASLDERPPRTRPRVRPCPATITSAMTLVSPWRRTPISRPSPDHCMSLGPLQPHLAIALRIVGPFLADLDEEEEVHGDLEDLHQLLAAVGADRLDGLASGAQNDLLVRVARDVDDLVDAVGTVLLDGELLGLDGGVVGDLVVDAQEQLFARDLGGGERQRQVGEVILGEVPGPSGMCASWPSRGSPSRHARASPRS